MTRPALRARAMAAAIVVAVLMEATLRADDRTVLVSETFDSPLDEGRWRALRVHAARSDLLEVRDGALALGLDTLGTDDATVKVIGVQATQALTLGSGLRVSVTLDWNDQTNGCYLTQGLVLLPPESLSANADPRKAEGALGFELVGVPPGRNVRPFLWRQEGGLLPLYTEGWPQPRRADRTGRHVRRATFELTLRRDHVALREDGRSLVDVPCQRPLQERLALLLYMTSHSNYPLRTVRFHDLAVEALEE